MDKSVRIQRIVDFLKTLPPMQWQCPGCKKTWSEILEIDSWCKQEYEFEDFDLDDAVGLLVLLYVEDKSALYCEDCNGELALAGLDRLLGCNPTQH